MGMRVEPRVEVWDPELAAWVPGEMETDGPEYATVRGVNDVVYVLTQDDLPTRMRAIPSLGEVTGE